MMYKKKLTSAFLSLAISLLLIASNTLFANNEYERLLSKDQAAEDIEVYFNIIDQQHGNPYQYISRNEFKALVDQTIAALPTNISFKEFEVILSELNHQIRCGHTTISMNTDMIKAATDQSLFFPYPVKFIDDQYFIDFEDGDIPLGSKILEINGHAIEKIKQDLLALTVTDGFSPTKPIREIESKFGYYFFLKYGGNQNFDVDYLTPEGKQVTKTIAGIQGNRMLANNYFRPVYKKHERYSHFTHLDAIDSLETLVLTLNTFQANPDWYYKKLAALYNKETKEFDFDNLVIDLRFNEGGDRRILNFLYEFIAGSDLVDPTKTSIRNRSIEYKDYLVGINGSNSSKQMINSAYEYLLENFEESGKAEVQNWHEKFELNAHWEGRPFKGQIYVLTSGKTFSAAADLARILGQLDQVTLVGEETGGAHEGRTANMLLNYSLPNTSTMVQVPVIYEEFVNTYNASTGRGTFPDHLVTQTYSDLLSKKDTAFEFTLKLIAQNSSMGTN